MTIHLTRRARRGSILGMTMILCVLATVLAVTTLSLGTHNRKLTLRSRGQNDATRAAISALNYTAAQVREKVTAPNAGTADAAIAALTLNPELPLARLGVDTTFYDETASSIEAVKIGAPFRANKAQFPLDASKPELQNDPDAGSYIDELWVQPIRVRVTLYPKGKGPSRSTVISKEKPDSSGVSGYVKPAYAFVCTMEASVQFRVKSLFQVAMYFNDVTPWLWGGANTYRGGIHSNEPIYIWASGNTEGARVQIERISAKKILFRNYDARDGWAGARHMGAVDPGHNQAVYISRGDLPSVRDPKTGELVPDGIITAYKSYPKSAQWYSQNETSPIWSSGRPADEYRPAYRTLWDKGEAFQSNFSNYWRKDTPAGSDNRYFRIDSDNPDIGNLSTLFNGNYKDDKTGFQEVKVSSLATTTPRSIIEPPEPSKNAKTDPVEAEKFANKAGVYVYVETRKRFNKDVVPRVIVFNNSSSRTAAEAVAAYKAASMNNEVQLEKIQKDLADNLLALPSGVIETSRRFVDYSQQKQTGTDSATPRVSAVDIDMGKLREALGTKDTPATAIRQLDVRTLHGQGQGVGNTELVQTDWNPNDTKSGWNGVLYVEVDKPQGDGWSAEAPPEGVTAAPLRDSAGNPTANLTAVRIHNAEQLPDRSGTPGYNRQEGLTLATNTVVYTVGNVNADGNRDTDPSFGTSSGDGSRAENNSAISDPKAPHQFPFAIAADAVTVMPGNHKTPDKVQETARGNEGDLTLGDNRANSRNTFNGIYDREKFTELNFGIIAGGGNPDANFKARRPLQPFTPSNWNNNDIRYRGSIVTLFESRFAKKWAGGNGTQVSQSIDIGFDRSYGRGFIPPGVPRSQTCVLANFALVADSDFANTTFPAPSRKTPSDPTLSGN